MKRHPVHFEDVAIDMTFRKMNGFDSESWIQCLDDDRHALVTTVI
jgi:hypothetical protein